MSRGRHSCAEEKKAWKLKYQQMCEEGKHTWRPFFCSERVGGIPEWNGKKVYCDYCFAESTLVKLEKSDKKLVKEIAKVLAGVHERVRQLYHPWCFSNSGIR